MVNSLRRATLLMALASGALAVWGAAAAQAQITAALQASFKPERLGASTSIGFSFTLGTTEGVAPPALTQVDLRMPKGINYASTTLGLALCPPEILSWKGAAGCPANSRLGSGSAFVEVPFGTEAGRELPVITAFMGPPHHNNMVVLFYAQGREPVFADILFTGELVPAGGIFGSELRTSIPLIPSVPNGPPVSIVRVSATIGPSHLTYYRRVHGRMRRFHPVGVGLPQRCPRGGFPFEADFTFLGGEQAVAHTSVPCPRRRR